MSVLQNHPARSVLAAAMLTALIASMLMFMPSAEAQSPSTTVTATPSSDATITVQWTSVTGVTQYDVQFIRGTGTGHDLNDVTARDVSSGYVSRSLLPNTEYSVRVFDASNKCRTRPHRRDDVCPTRPRQRAENPQHRHQRKRIRGRLDAGPKGHLLQG